MFGNVDVVSERQLEPERIRFYSADSFYAVSQISESQLNVGKLQKHELKNKKQNCSLILPSND